LKKNSSKLGAKGIKRSGILRFFQKCVDILHQQDFFSEKVPEKSVFLYKIFPFCKTQDICTFLKSAQHYASFEFFSTLIRGGATFFGG
jgi:hypothetical protein